MSILPVMTARVIMQKLARGGFEYLYTKGSHYYFRHPITRYLTSVPFHGSKNIGRGLIATIIKQAGLTVKQFIDL